MAEEKITIPDIGGVDNVDVIEVFVKPGDQIQKEDSVLTLESDKASMEVPSPAAGIVKAVHVALGDKVSEGDLMLTVETNGAAKIEEEKPVQASVEKTVEKPKVSEEANVPTTVSQSQEVTIPDISGATDVDVIKGNKTIYAGPAVRRLARELGVDLTKVRGTGQKGRLLTDDVKRYVKETLSNPNSSGGGLGFNLPPLSPMDFSKFGEITTKPLNKIKRLTGSFLHRNWLTVPHVTQFGDADITELEAFRKQYKGQAEKQGFKLTPIVFVMKAVVAALKAYPQFNASLDETGENLILKQYYHIGVAVDTPNGLVVPVIRDVDQKGIFELAKEIGEISKQAREKGLTPSQMQGGCFSISSLGGIGGTAFTPIVNLPEVAILGLSKSTMKPVYQTGEFVPRLMLPMSLSYDHRVIDGADAARFITYLADGLADLRLALL